MLKILNTTLLFLVFSSFFAFTKVDFSVQDIGTLQTHSSIPFALNNKGQILIRYNLDGSNGSEHFFVRNRDGSSHAIPIVNDGISVSWRYLTDDGKVYGTFDGDIKYSILFMWDKENGVVNLGELPGKKIVKINNKGQVLINAIKDDSGDKTIYYPVIWDGGRIIKLIGLSGDLGVNSEMSYALDMNNNGDVVGYSNTPIIYKNNVYTTAHHAVIWVNGQPEDLHKELPKDCQKYPLSTSIAFAINDIGEIAFKTSDGGGWLLFTEDKDVVSGFNDQYLMNNSYIYNKGGLFEKPSSNKSQKLILNLSSINYKILQATDSIFKKVTRIIAVNESGEIALVGETIYGEEHGVFITDLTMD